MFLSQDSAPMPTVMEMVEAHHQDPYCWILPPMVGSDPTWSFNEISLLCRRLAVYVSIQIIVPQMCRGAVLHHAHYPKRAGHPGARRMYGSLRRKHYRPQVPTYVHNLVSQYQSCRRHQPFGKHQILLKLFHPSRPLEFVAYKYSLAACANKARKLVCSRMKDRFSKLVKAIPSAKITASNIATAVLENWLLFYGAPDIILTDNGKKLTCKLFAALCASLEMKLATTTKYRPQTNIQIERYSRTPVARLRHCIDKRQQN